MIHRIALSLSLIVFSAPLLVGQSPIATPSPSATPGSTLYRPKDNFARDLARDQKAIWTSPFHLDRGDLKWLLPFGGGTAALIATDRHTSSWVDSHGSLPAVSQKVSWFGKPYTTFGAAGGMYIFGKLTHDEHLRETGRLGVEALLDVAVPTLVTKAVAGRLRPDMDGGRGRFFQSGGRSFFSGHSSASWSLATVVACEYSDHKLAVYGSYAAATAVALSRYSGRKHFLSDIVIGSAVGYATGRYVCRKHGHFGDAEEDDDITMVRRWQVSPYVDPLMDVRGGSLRWSF